MLPPVQNLPHSIYVEVAIPQNTSASALQIPFPWVPELAKHKCTGFVAYTAEVLQSTRSDQATITLATSQNLYLTIKDTNATAFIDLIPYGFFCPLEYSQPVRPFEKPMVLDLANSYIQGSSLTAAAAFAVFNFFFLK